MKRAALILTALSVALYLPAISAQRTFIDYPKGAETDFRPPDYCKQYFHDVCNNWKIAAWLPVLKEGFADSDQHKAAQVPFMDGFVYENRIPRGMEWKLNQGSPEDGTPFVYGQAAPRGDAIYDSAHSTVFYAEGCCAWHSTVLASNIAAPPIPIVDKDLSALRTVHGIRLGQTRTQVETIYGKTFIQHASWNKDIEVLSYVHPLKYPCEQDQNFGFWHGHLFYIEISGGC